MANPPDAWYSLQHNAGSERHWHWLPGWHFHSTVFQPLYQQLPGHHWGANYQAVNSPEQLFDKTRFAHTLQANSVFIGWSLGAALLQRYQVHIAALQPHLQLGLANAQAIAQQPSWRGFVEQLHSTPQAAHALLNRFVRLCLLGSRLGPELTKWLDDHRVHDLDTLTRTLTWLTECSQPYSHAPTTKPLLQWHGQHDAIIPAPASAKLLGHSHLFFLEPDCQPLLREALQTWQ